MSEGIGIAEAAASLLLKTYVKSGQACPVCQTEMITSRNETTDWSTGSPKPSGHHMPPMCPACGYAVSVGKTWEIKSSYGSSASWHQQAKKQDAMAYYKVLSVCSDASITKKTLATFQKLDDQQSAMFTQAQKALRDIRDGKTVHAVFIGATGTGKTHIANGILLAAMSATGYDQKGFFMDWQEFISMSKEAISGTPDRKKRIQNLQDEFSKADIIVLDDIGSERDTESNYAADQMDRFWRKRENKNVIVTTNLTMQQLESRYGERVVSRIKNHGRGHGYIAKQMQDMRTVPF